LNVFTFEQTYTLDKCILAADTLDERFELAMRRLLSDAKEFAWYRGGWIPSCSEKTCPHISSSFDKVPGK